MEKNQEEKGGEKGLYIHVLTTLWMVQNIVPKSDLESDFIASPSHIAKS